MSPASLGLAPRFGARDGGAMKTFEGTLSAAGFDFAIVISRFNDFVAHRLLSGALDALRRHGVDEDRVLYPFDARRICITGFSVVVYSTSFPNGRQKKSPAPGVSGLRIFPSSTANTIFTTPYPGSARTILLSDWSQIKHLIRTILITNGSIGGSWSGRTRAGTISMLSMPILS